MIRTAALLLALALTADPLAAQSPMRLQDRDGNPVVLPALGAITVVQFMATWCAPCHEQTKALVELHAAYASRGVRLVAVSLDRRAEHALLPIYIQDFAVPYEIVVGGTVEHLKEYGFGDSLPGVVLFDRDGAVFDTVVGVAPPAVLADRLDWLTGDRAGPRPARFVPPRAEREEDELPHVHASAMLAAQAGRRPGSLVPS